MVSEEQEQTISASVYEPWMKSEAFINHNACKMVYNHGIRLRMTDFLIQVKVQALYKHTLFIQGFFSV
jgi:hypothetical protein